MITIPYDSLNLEELEHIERNVSKAILEYQNRKRREAIDQLNAVAKQMGFTSAAAVLGQLPPVGAPTKKGQSQIVYYYRNPENHNQVCGKRGRKPDWFRMLKQRGYTDEQLMISSNEGLS